MNTQKSFIEPESIGLNKNCLRKFCNKYYTKEYEKIIELPDYFIKLPKNNIIDDFKLISEELLIEERGKISTQNCYKIVTYIGEEPTLE